MKRKGLMISGLVLSLLMVAPTMESYADEVGTFSEFWVQDAEGNWKVQDANGNVIKNAWLCDDAVTSNGKDVWYLLDANGNMVTAGLVQDGTGNYYSLETNHNGFYGMLRYKSGNYDGINLSLEGSHGGAFASVLNQDGLEALKARYGVTSVSNISNANCVYTSSFAAKKGSSSTNTNSTTKNQDSQAKNSNVSYDSSTGMNHLAPPGDNCKNQINDLLESDPKYREAFERARR